jgi:hypothetical protein
MDLSNPFISSCAEVASRHRHPPHGFQMQRTMKVPLPRGRTPSTHEFFRQHCGSFQPLILVIHP